ncbi:MAG: hypothetical protein ACI8S6_001176 [Myxococcota bacterium]
MLDLWHDEDFWERDAVTISTDGSYGSYGTDFRFSVDGGGPLVISDDPEASYTVEMRFDLPERFTWWEDLPTGDPAEADGTFTVGSDCGLRILFPDVLINLGG